MKGFLVGIGIFFIFLSLVFISIVSKKLDIVYFLLSMVFFIVGGGLIAKNND